MNDQAKMWAKRVAAWRDSGLTPEAFSRGHGFTAGALRYWVHRLDDAPAPQPRGGQATQTTSPAAPPPVRLVRVVRQAGGRETAPPRPAHTRARRDTCAPSPAPAALMLKVGAVRIAVPPGFDRETLTAVLAVLAQGDAR